MRISEEHTRSSRWHSWEVVTKKVEQPEISLIENGGVEQSYYRDTTPEREYEISDLFEASLDLAGINEESASDEEKFQQAYLAVVLDFILEDEEKLSQFEELKLKRLKK